MEKPARKRDYGMMEGWLSILVNVLLFALKYTAGILSGSLAIIADAWHTISDSLTSVVVLVVTRLSKKPADREHPFGHGRAVIIGSVIIGALLAVVALEIVIDAISRFREKSVVAMGWLPITALLVSVLLKEAMAQMAMWAGRRENNPSVISDGWHHRSDAISSGVVLVGLLLGKNVWWIDSALGLVIAGYLAYLAYRIIRESANPLLGEEPNREIISRIKEMARQMYHKDLRIHHFHIHNYGNHKEMTFHIVLPKEMKMEEAQEITTGLFRRIHDELGIVATIHIDTESKH